MLDGDRRRADVAGDRAEAERLLFAPGRPATSPAACVRRSSRRAETVRLAPTYWRSRDDVARYAEAAPHIDFAVRNVRVLARSALSAVETNATVPPGIPAALRELATAVERARARARARSGAPPRRSRLRSPPPAARRARSAADTTIPVTVIVGQVRSTAVDLLRALGIDRFRGRRARPRGGARMSTDDVDDARDDHESSRTARSLRSWPMARAASHRSG